MVLIFVPIFNSNDIFVAFIIYNLIDFSANFFLKSSGNFCFIVSLSYSVLSKNIPPSLIFSKRSYFVKYAKLEQLTKLGFSIKYGELIGFLEILT